MGKGLLIVMLVQIAIGVIAIDEQTWLPSYWSEEAKKQINEAKNMQPNTNVAKNIIFFIGDGMGVSTVTAARILKGQMEGELGEEGFLAWEKFPHVAFSKTYSTNAMTTDSAGSATAFHHGFKTKLGVIGTDDRVIKGNCSTQAAASSSTSILQWAEEAGKATGFVTTTKVTHASPSPLYAKAADRDWESDANLPSNAIGICKDIAVQLIENGLNIEVAMGGGRQNFMPNTQVDPEYSTVTGKRKDGRNLLEEWQLKQVELKKTCKYVWNQTEFDKVDPSIDCLLALFEPTDMIYEDKRKNLTDNEPSLTQMVEKAIQILRKSSNGFYLFVEGGRIDHGHHGNQARYALTEAIEMHKAVEKAYSMTNSADTLIVVSADHSHVFTLGGYAKRGNPILGLNSGAESGSDLAGDSKPFTSLLYGNGPGYTGGERQNLTGVQTDTQGYRYQSAVPINSETHGGEDVAIYASGPMSHLFHGVQEQSYIPHAMAYAACIGADKSHCDSPQTTATYTTVKGAGARITFCPAIVLLSITACRWF